MNKKCLLLCMMLPFLTSCTKNGELNENLTLTGCIFLGALIFGAFSFSAVGFPAPWKIKSVEALYRLKKEIGFIAFFVLLGGIIGGNFFFEPVAQVVRQILYEEKTVLKIGEIDGNLAFSLARAEIPREIRAKFISLVSRHMDFQPEHCKGNFEIAYERVLTNDGEYVCNGEILHALLRSEKGRVSLYRHESNGKAAYYDENGFVLEQVVNRKPLAFQAARISSYFGMRTHPIKRRRLFHAGVDYAAPRGTEVYAAASGVVQYVGYNGGYGKMVEVKHNDVYSTGYGHLSRFAQGIKPGTHVKQGQVIGYVGSTGLSTGPHLHFELMSHGKKVNPLKVEARIGRNLEGAELKSFMAFVCDIKAQMDSTLRAPGLTADIVKQ